MRVMLAVWGALMVAGSDTAAAQSLGTIAEMAQTPVITLRIAESLRRPPDQATLSVSTQAKAPTASGALTANKAKTEKLVSAIRAAGIAAKDIRTEGVNISPDYRYEQVAGRSQSRMIGYVASNSVRIKTRQIDGLSSLLDALTAAGADRVHGPNFEISEPAPLRSEARRLAMLRGLAEAGEYARNAGFAQVRLLSVEEGVSSRASDAIIVTGSRLAAPPPPAPPPPGGDGSIQPGQIETGVTLTLRYRMER
ncbi:MAG: SIMPL domain-containing protein [Pseudomonadota bacterium]|nr:SIMPL domain-containing protein [Pseudomonadota bacterium]